MAVPLLIDDFLNFFYLLTMNNFLHKVSCSFQLKAHLEILKQKIGENKEVGVNGPFWNPLYFWVLLVNWIVIVDPSSFLILKRNVSG